VQSGDFGVTLNTLEHQRFTQQITMRLVRAAQLAHNINAADQPITLIAQTRIWPVGGLTIMHNEATDELFLAGSTWHVILNHATRDIHLGGIAAGDPIDGMMPVSQREFFTLLLAATGFEQQREERRVTG